MCLAATWFALTPVASAQTAQTPAAADAAPVDSMARSTTTDADMDDLQARSHFRLGRKYYQLGRFAEAGREFEVAYGLSGRAALLYNVYISYRDALDTAKAAAALRGYLAAVPDAPDRDGLTARLTALEAQVEQARADAEREQAQRVEVERLQHEAQERARRQPTHSAQLPAPETRPTASQPQSSSSARPWWPWIVVGAGVVATAGGLTLGALASSDATKLRSQCVADPRTDGSSAPLVPGSSCAPSVDLESRRSAIQTQALVGDVMWIGGAAITLTGIVLSLVWPAEQRKSHPLPLSAACLPGDCRASLKLQF